MKIFKVFFGWVFFLKLNLRFLLRKVKLNKMIAGVGFEPNHVWVLKLRLQRKFKIRDFYLLGSYPLVGRHVVNEIKVGCYVVNELEVS